MPSTTGLRSTPHKYRKQYHKWHIDQVYGKCQYNGENPKDLDIRRKQLIDQKIQIGNQSHKTIFRIQENTSVTHHALKQPNMPTSALFAQVSQFLRRLCPANSVCGIADAIRILFSCNTHGVLPPIPYPHQWCPGHIPCFHNGVFMKQPKSTGNDDTAVEPVKSILAARKERSYSNTCIQGTIWSGIR